MQSFCNCRLGDRDEQRVAFVIGMQAVAREALLQHAGLIHRGGIVVRKHSVRRAAYSRIQAFNFRMSAGDAGASGGAGCNR